VTGASATTIPSPPAGSPAAIAHRLARGVFFLALGAMFVGTLWPRLGISPADAPTDKLLHAATFGVLTAMLALARPWRGWWWPAAIMLAIGAIDEWLQAIPMVNRSCDLDDWIADATGIALAGAFIGAASPVGQGAALVLEERRRAAGWILRSRATTWMHLGIAAVLGFAAGAPLGVLLDSWFVRKGPQPWQYGLIGGLMGTAVGVHALWESGVRARLRTGAAERPCLGCGASAAPDAAACAACGRMHRPTDWAPIAPLDGRAELHACALPIAVSFAAVVVVSAVAIAVVTALRLRSDLVMRVDTWYRLLPADARILGDLALVAIAGSWGVRRCRVRIAERIARSGSECLRCGFDLRATAPGAAVGACPECEGGFIRVDARGEPIDAAPAVAPDAAPARAMPGVTSAG
jgi:hypothetical protein